MLLLPLGKDVFQLGGRVLVYVEEVDPVWWCVSGTSVDRRHTRDERRPHRVDLIIVEWLLFAGMIIKCELVAVDPTRDAGDRPRLAAASKVSVVTPCSSRHARATVQPAMTFPRRVRRSTRDASPSPAGISKTSATRPIARIALPPGIIW